MGIIALGKLVKSFGSFTAVDKVDLDIKEGEIYGLLGPNGAGKSTIINMICGLVKPTEGVIKIDNKTMKENEREAKRKIGIVLQDIAIYGELTCAENVKFFASL